MTKPVKFTSLYLACGLGAGARGFLEAKAELGPDSAQFVNLGGIDLDPHSCADFRRLARGPALEADLSKLTPAELIAWLTKEHGREVALRRPDCVFSSFPCKGFSRLLGHAKSLEPKYQALNRLVFQGLFLMCETWSEPPPTLVFENVPGIMTRGAEVLRQVRQLLTQYGYVFHESTHDCGEIGGLAQHRKRYLMVARRPSIIPGFVYQPPKKRVRACGEVLTDLPIPGMNSEGGVLHQLPKLSWLNWVRLALIPAGGDWRDLPSAVTLEQTAKAADTFKGRPGLFGVQEWSEPAPTVSGSMSVSGSNGTAAVADPRLDHEPRRNSLGVGRWDKPAKAVRGRADVRTGEAALADPRLTHLPRPGALGVLGWDEPSRAITESNVPGSVADPRVSLSAGRECPSGCTCKRHGKSPRHSTKYRMEKWGEPAHTITGGDARVGSGAPNVVDPRLTDFLAALMPGELSTPVRPGQARREVFGRFDNRPWTEPARTVAGDGSNGGYAVSDPRASRLGVVPWEKPAGTIAGESYPTNGAFSVADPRLAVTHRAGRHSNNFRIREWSEPAGTVTGDTDIQAGAASVADVRLNRNGRTGFYGVISWQDALGAVTGNARVDNGAFAIADPRKPHTGRVPIIIAADGAWHRPITTLELAALQAIPVILDGKPLELSGDTIQGWRERIGNAVPVKAGKAIALSVLKALLAGHLGTWFLSMTDEPIWVRRRDGYPDLVEVTV